MSFYGNISNAGRTNLTFDKIYSSRYQMEEAFKQGDGVFVGRYVLIEYDDNTFSRREGYINKENNDNVIYADTTYNVPYVKSDSTIDNLYGIVIGDLIYVEDGNKVNYYICDGFNNDNNAVFSLVQIAKIKDAPNDYILNYTIDKNWANTKGLTKEFENCQGWDSTIWQKTLINGKAKYKMIGSLNSKNPTFYIEAEAPSTEPIAPHFGQNSTNQEYVLHTQPTWGFRVKRAHDENLSDQEINQKYIGYDADDTDKKINNLEKYNGAIYFNNDGFDSLYRNKDTETVTEITLSNSGYSGKEYIIHDNTPVQKFEQKPDIQELTVHLPAIGNAISDLWDIVYGEFEYDDDGNIIYQTDEEGNTVSVYKDIRNKDIEWGSTEGTRMVNTIASGYSYNPEKTQTIAGAINSVHDLMGMIVYNDPDITLNDANTESIYYRPQNFNDEEKIYGYYIKEPKCEYTVYTPTFVKATPPYSSTIKYYIFEDNNYKVYTGNLNNNLELYTCDIDEYTNEKIYQELIQYQKGTYHTTLNENYYLELNDAFTPNMQYYEIKSNEIKLMPWEKVIIDPDNFINQTLNHYYKKENNYLFDDNIEPDENRDYVSIKINQSIYPPSENSESIVMFYYPEKLCTIKNEETGLRSGYVYYIKDDIEDEYKVIEIDEDEFNNLDPQPDQNERFYYYVKEYKIHSATNEETGKIVKILTYNDEYNTPITKDTLEKNNLSVTMLSLEDLVTNKYYSKVGNDFIYLSNSDNVDTNIIYYQIVEEINETEKIKDDSTGIEIISKHYYKPNVYYYQYGFNEQSNNRSYILSTKSIMPKDKIWFTITASNVNTAFYQPNKYYYEENGIEILDTAPEKTNGRKYYLKGAIYVIEDTAGILSPGSIWDSGYPIPSSITLGQLINKKFQWKELKGFSRSLNTVNGLILKLNQFFKFDDLYTRDRDTIQGCLNCLNDLINDFGELNPGEIAVIDEYGRLKSAKLFTTEDDGGDGWISVNVNDSVADTKITFRHEPAKSGETIKVQPNSEIIKAKFNESFDVITNLNIDEKGHVHTGIKQTIELPKYTIAQSDNNANVLTRLNFNSETNEFILTEQNAGTLKLTGYKKLDIAEDLKGGQASISADDTINDAFNKLDQFTLNEAKALDSEIERAKKAESDLNTKIDLVFDDKDTSDLDSVVDLINWTAEHGKTVEEILNSINDNKKAIESNDADILKLQNDLSTTNTNLNNVNTTLGNKINTVESNLSSSIGDNKDAIDALKLLVGEKPVNTQIGEAIAAKNLDQYATDTELNALNERVGNLENNTYQSQIDTLNATIEALQNTIKDLTARIEVLEELNNPTPSEPIE